MTFYGCNNCNETTTDLKLDEWIELGGKGKSFFFINHNEKNKNAFANFSPKHFCSEKCFTNHFLGK